MIILILPLLLHGIDLAKSEDFIDMMVKKHHFDREYLTKLFSSANFTPKSLKIYNTPFKKYLTDASWQKYKTKIITPKKIAKCKVFMREYKEYLDKASKIYQVPKEYITAFIAIESDLGRVYGDENIFNNLTTLALYKNRKQLFFKKELEEFLLLSREKGFDPRVKFGSFAGAMGCVQQLPSIHRRYGVDLDGDGVSDEESMADCIGTIANFMHQNGWKNKRVVTIKAKYKGRRYRGLKSGYNKIYSINFLKKHGITPQGRFTEGRASLLQLRGKDHDELWLGAKNFRVLTRYNNSTNYGMAIYQIVNRLQALKEHHRQ